jgi:hypothetical protein
MKVTAAAILWIALSFLATSCGAGSADVTQGSKHSDAASLLLVRSNFPAGWKVLPYKQYTAAAKTFRECITPATSDVTIIGEADEMFYRVNTATWSGATVFGNAEQASDALRGITSAAVERCFRDLFKKNMAIEGQTNASVGKVHASKLDGATEPDIDETIDWRIATPVTLAPGATVTNNTDLVTLRDGDAVVIFATDNGIDPVDAGLRDQLLEKLARRLSSNQ